MNRAQFMEQLEKLLSDISEEERREAIRMNRVVSDMGCHLESTVNRDPKDTARMRLQRSKSDI